MRHELSGDARRPEFPHGAAPTLLVYDATPNAASAGHDDHRGLYYAAARGADTGDVVPTGLAVSGNSIYLAQAGPIPHEPQTGRVVVFGPTSTTATEVAAGARLAVDVEFGTGHTLFALSQGFWDGPSEGTPAQPNTGALMRVNGHGTLTTVADGLDRPTSVAIINNTAYVVTLGGEIWTVDNIDGPPSEHGR